MSSFCIRPASRKHAAAIVKLFRAAFAPELLELTIYGCRGIQDFVGLQIAAPRHASDTGYTVALEGSRVLGCLESRWLPDALVINYLAVAEGARGRGIGTRLMLDAAARGGTSIALDVLKDNLPARSWYRRLGFREIGRTDFTILDGHRSPNGPFFLTGYPQAKAAYKQFGFSEFRIRTGAGEHCVGILGNNYFRIQADSIRQEPRLPAILRQLDGRRRILCLATGAGPGRKVLRLVRMTASPQSLICCES